MVAASRALGQDRLPARQSGAGRLRLLADEQATVPIDHGAHARLRDYISTSFLVRQSACSTESQSASPTPDGLLNEPMLSALEKLRPGLRPMGHDPVTTARRCQYRPRSQQTQPDERASARRVAPSHCHPESVTFSGSRAKSGCAPDQ